MKNTTDSSDSIPTGYLARLLRTSCLLSLMSGIFMLTALSGSLHGSPSQSGHLQSAGAIPQLQESGGAFRIAPRGPDAAQVQCRVHQLEGDITWEGLTLRSTRHADAKASLRLVSDYLGRDSGAMVALPRNGIVEVDNSTLVRFVRPHCTEEFRVGLDGIRQDFVIARPPAGHGLLRLELQVHEARVEEQDGRIELHLNEAKRVLTYSRLHVEDAAGKALPADMIRVDAERIALRVDDSMATYPLRIDPTFSDANWTGLGGISGTDASVRAIVVDASGNVYIGGTLSVVGNVRIQQIGMWDGTRWSDLGEGLPIAVDRMVLFEGSLYAGGKRSELPGYQVVKREGSVWVPVGGVFSDRIEALKPHLGSLHAAGWFATIDGVTVNHIARWDGTTWQALGSGIGGLVRDILSFDGNLIAGGPFTTVGGVPTSRVALWNGTAWSAMGSGLASEIHCLVDFNGNLVAGGSFNQAGGNPALRVAVWNGTSWGGIGGMTENFVSVFSLAVSGNTLYAAGNFTEVSGQPAHGLAQLNQTTWSAVGTGFTGPAGIVATFGSSLYVGGGRVDDGGFSSSGFSWWDGTRWDSLGDTPVGIGGSVLAMAWYEDALHVGGFFRTAGGKVVNHVARWDGSEWHALDGGVSNGSSTSVNSLVVFDGDLYIAGTFSRAGNVAARNLARWNGESWSPLKGGTVNTVNSMTTFNDKLVIGGGLILVDGIFVQNLIQWDGEDWVQTAGFGTGGTVNALTVHDGELYVGGSFFSPPNNLAKWNGSSFSAVGTGFNSAVNSLHSSNGKLFAGGRFTFAGGVPVNNIAEWNGSSWQAMGTGVNLTVSSIAEFGSHVFVSGERGFSQALPSGHLLSWNGTEWSVPGSGVNGQVHALLPTDDVLYVGGAFSMAGGNVAAALAKLDLQVSAPSHALGIEAADTLILLRFSGTPGTAYHILRSPEVGTGQVWSTITPAPLIAGESGEFEFTDDEPLPGAAYYRAQQVE